MFGLLGLRYAIIADYFPVGIAARANGALNLMHFGWAFAAQYGIGLIVSQWTPQDGHYPLAAYQAAFGLNLALQALALLRFAIPWLKSSASYLRLLFSSPDSRAELVRAISEEPILETAHAHEW